jgi:hypothetical protein
MSTKLVTTTERSSGSGSTSPTTGPRSHGFARQRDRSPCRAPSRVPCACHGSGRHHDRGRAHGCRRARARAGRPRRRRRVRAGGGAVARAGATRPRGGPSPPGPDGRRRDHGLVDRGGVRRLRRPVLGHRAAVPLPSSSTPRTWTRDCARSGGRRRGAEAPRCSRGGQAPARRARLRVALPQGPMRATPVRRIDEIAVVAPRAVRDPRAPARPGLLPPAGPRRSSGAWSRSAGATPRTDWLADVLAARDRSGAARVAPPQGLTLEGVRYGRRWPAVPAGRPPLTRPAPDLTGRQVRASVHGRAVRRVREAS